MPNIIFCSFFIAKKEPKSLVLIFLFTHYASRFNRSYNSPPKSAQTVVAPLNLKAMGPEVEVYEP